jgi:predicted P-loop ATPase
MIKVKNGASLKLYIATARNRYDKTWKNTQITWSSLVEKISKTFYTHETRAEYAAMNKDQQGEIKDIGGFVGGRLRDGRRKEGYVESRSLITLDADYATPELWDDIRMFNTYAMACYSTHKHTPQKPRLRLIIPLAREVTPEEYQAISRKLADQIGIDLFDDTTYQPERLMYWPSTSKDAEYFFDFIDLPILDPDSVLAEYPDWTDASYWPESSRAQQTRKKTADKQGDPLEKDGLIGAFCRTYSIHDAIDKFLPDIYTEAGENRYTYTKGSTSGGLVVYDDKFAYSNHSTDPTSGQLCNAFDLVRIHLFGELDEEAKEDTPVNKLPSWVRMMVFVRTDEEVRQTIGLEKLQDAKDEFSDLGVDEADTAWLKKLKLDGRGHYEWTIDNILIILKNDPNLNGIGRKNKFNYRLEVPDKLPWTRDCDYWTDADESALRHYLENVYEIQGARKVADALAIVFEDNAYHPVRDYLESITWDGIPRAEKLFIDFLGAKDCVYVRTVTRKALAAAVTRIYDPGHKFDTMTVLVGPQGMGKSYLLSKLGGEWFSDTLTSIQGKEAYEALEGVWIVEMGELAALKKSEVETIKHYISKQSDTFRHAYAHYTTVGKRQCIFFGTTNNHDFLKDPTGGRRFWVIDVDEEQRTKTVWDDFTPEYRDQVWAEAVHFYKMKEPIEYLEKDIEAQARNIQRQHSELNGKEGIIREFLTKQIPDGWNTMDIIERQRWIAASQDFKDDKEGPLKPRTRVCAIEIWCEAFNGNPKDLTGQISREINDILENIEGWKRNPQLTRYGIYGVQRGFSRKLADSELDW